jgi:omega-6 fatty acid desaturase (delta-12 desaturase)
VLVKYREPVATRSITELVVTIAPFTLLWALACWALSISNLLALSLAALNALFLVRIFMIQHDCGHGAFFKSRPLSDWIGRALGVITLTPYDVWRKTHAIHHASTGNLDRRGTGDIPTLTVREYRARSWLGKAVYRLYRHPVFLFGFSPFYVFFVQNRLPFGLMASGWRYWVSAMGTNIAIAAALVGLFWLGGPRALLLVFLPTMLLGASIGMWLFYVQHQFRETSWDSEDSWKVQDAALEGSSYYVLPEPLRWFSANIGAHHVHHMASRIPYYRLPEVLRDHEPLAQCHRLTLRESFGCARLRLWDEDSRQLVSFKEARALG